MNERDSGYDLKDELIRVVRSLLSTAEGLLLEKCHFLLDTPILTVFFVMVRWLEYWHLYTLVLGDNHKLRHRGGASEFDAAGDSIILDSRRHAARGGCYNHQEP